MAPDGIVYTFSPTGAVKGRNVPMEATEHYRIGLCKEKVTSTDLANERQRLLGALCGDDLNKALPEVRAMLERQLRAVEAEQAARRAADQ